MSNASFPGLRTSILIFFILTPILILNIKPVSAIPGVAVDDPSNQWAPYGPLVKNIQLKFYSDPQSEFADFIAGKIDLTDWQQSKTSFASYDNNPDFLLSPVQGQFGEFGIYFNGLDTTWAAWGCDWTLHTPYTDISGASHPYQTYSSACGINMRQAFLHLVDRPAFARDVLGGTAQALADPSPTSKDPSASPLSTQCSWDSLYPSTKYPTCLSAYNFADDPGGFARPGSVDFCAAADHMIMAGVATGEQPGTCILTGVNPGVYTNPIKGMIRNDDPRRLALGNGFMNMLNQLMSGTVVYPTYGTINKQGAIVFTDPPESPIDDWSFYTFAYGFGGQFPDHLFDLYYSSNASDLCGGPNNPEPDNPTFVCMKNLDNIVITASTTADISNFRTATLAAFDEYGKHAVDMTAFTMGIRLAALRSVAGLVNSRGISYNNPYTVLNAHKDPNFTPVNPIYAFGGGDPSRLRWGQAQPIFQMNIFHAGTEWEFQGMREIYDTLLAGSPVEIAKPYCWMCDTFTQSLDFRGDTHFVIELRQNLRWHDGERVDAKDVAFSLLAIRDFAPVAGGGLYFLKSVKVFSSTQLDVTFTGQSLVFPIDMEAYVIPRHIWECATDNTCAQSVSSKGTHGDYVAAGVLEPSIVKRSISFDPVANGALIGSGPFMCRSIFPEDQGKVGTGCTKNDAGNRIGQSIPAGGTMLLQAFDFTNQPGNTDPFYQYMRSYNPSWGTGIGTNAFSGQFQEFSWADQNNDAQVNITDLVGVGACWHASQPTAQCPASQYNYWLKPAFHPDSPNTISSEVAIVAAHMDDSYVFPYSWNPPNLENITPFTP